MFALLVDVPPQKLAISGWRYALGTSLTESEPINIVNWVMMRLFEHSGHEWLYNTSGVTNSGIEEGEGTIVWATNANITLFVVESHGTKRRWWEKCFFWEIWILQVPDVRLSWHVVRHLLETEHGVGNTDSHFSSFWMPGDLGGRTLEVVGVLEDHHGFGGNTFREMLRLFTSEILLEQIDFVVLKDALGGSLNHILCSLSET